MIHHNHGCARNRDLDAACDCGAGTCAVPDCDGTPTHTAPEIVGYSYTGHTYEPIVSGTRVGRCPAHPHRSGLSDTVLVRYVLRQMLRDLHDGLDLSMLARLALPTLVDELEHARAEIEQILVDEFGGGSS